MRRDFRFILVLTVSIVIALGCTAVQAGQGKIMETLKGSGLHEDCEELTPGQVLDYQFESSKPLDFNIHYHDDSGISYPVKKDNIAKDQGVFRPDKKQFYCLMWTNPGSTPVEISYTKMIRKEQ